MSLLDSTVSVNGSSKVGQLLLAQGAKQRRPEPYQYRVGQTYVTRKRLCWSFAPVLRAAAEHEQLISMLFNKRNGSMTVAS
jgi:hypothetical protein